MRKRTQDDASDHSADDTDMAVDGTGTGRRHNDVEVHEQHKRVRGLHDSPGAASTASGIVAVSDVTTTQTKSDETQT